MSHGRQHTDGFLARLIEATESTGEDGFFKITTIVGGSLISGELIRGEAYFKELAEGITGEHSGLVEVVKGFIGKFEKFYSDSTRIRQEKEDAGFAEIESPRFLHLRNVKIAMANQQPINIPSFRIPIESIDGYTLAEMSEG